MKHYEKPAMNFVSLRNENTVAKTCWGHHHSGKTLYCDVEGEGYCSFQIARGSCTLSLMNVQYYKHDGAEGVAIYDGHPDYDSQYDDLVNRLIKSGGESGNNFAGEGTVVTEDPLPEWS